MVWSDTQLQEVAVTAVRTEPYNAVQVGIKNKSPKNVHSGLLGQFRKNNVDPKYALAEFKVSEDALLQPGELDCFQSYAWK